MFNKIKNKIENKKQAKAASSIDQEYASLGIKSVTVKSNENSMNPTILKEQKDAVLKTIHEVKNSLLGRTIEFNATLDNLYNVVFNQAPIGNIQALRGIDNLIAYSAQALQGYLVNYNKVAIRTCIRNIEKYVTSRAQCDDAFASAEYRKLCVVGDKLSIELANMQNDRLIDEKSLKSLVEEYNKAEYNVEKQQIMTQINVYKGTVKQYNVTTERLERVMILTRNLQMATKERLKLHSFSGIASVFQEFEKATEIAMENNYDDQSMRKLESIYEKSLHSVSTNDIVVTSNQTTVDGVDVLPDKISLEDIMK